MLEFIKNVLEKPSFTEDEKLEMLKIANNKKIYPKELAEIVNLIKSKQAIKLDLFDSIDICGTGGSGLDRINTSTLTCLKLAKMGIKVAKHGNNASSGRFGSFDLIEKLGYKIPNSKEEILEEYEKNNIAFLYAKKLYPFFSLFANVRKIYGKPTIFNILGPLLNPANTENQMIGCSFLDKMELMIETCKILGRKNALLMRGEDGLDEITLSGKTKIFELKNGKIKEYEISPEDFGFEKVNIEKILAKEIEEKIEIAKKIILGEKVGAYSDLVDFNVKVCLKFLGMSN